MKRMSHKAFQLIRYAPPPAPRILGVCCKDGVIRQWRSGKKIPSFFFFFKRSVFFVRSLEFKLLLLIISHFYLRKKT